MDDSTPNLSLPYLMAAQAQKHIIHNEAIRALDALVLLSVIDNELATPPSSPADGNRYLVPAGATGAWSGRAGALAAFQDGAWAFYSPKAGWTAWVIAADALHVFDGAAWSPLSGTVALNPAALVGINSTADTTNRLAIASPASLFSHDGHGHQQKINKSTAAETASTIYQSDFSGRAEIGLAGDDDFHFKVSADGETWREALILERTTGTPRIPTFAAASVPSASVAGAGAIIFVPDATDGASLAVSDGASWQLITGSMLQVAEPGFAPEPGEYASPQSVTMSCATPGAAIHYTTDGSTPTSSSTLYAGAVAISETTTLKAIAVKSGMLDSEVASAAYTITHWYEAAEYAPSSGAADVILDFVNARYRAGGASSTLTSLISNPTTLDASGMPLSATNIAATGALLTALQSTACTVIVEIAGQTPAGNRGILTWDSGNNWWLIGLTGGLPKVRTSTGSIINTPNVINFAGTNICGLAFDGSGRTSIANGYWGKVTDANTYAARSAVSIGAFSGAAATGYLQRMWVFTRRLSDADLALVTRPDYAPLKGTGSLMFLSGEQLVVNDAGRDALNWERTQAWSVGFAIRKATFQSFTQIFGNPTAPPGPYRASMEGMVNSAGKLHARIMSNAFGGPNTNYLGVVGSTVIVDDKVHVCWMTYDGSSAAAGLKLYVDGTAETPSLENDGLTGTTIASPVNPFKIGNHVGVETDAMLYGLLDHLVIYNRELSAAEVAARSTLSTLPGVEANQVLRYLLDEGTGTVVNDSSGNGYHGTISNAAMWVT